jgi:molybdopterin molybdotransferase
MQMRPFGRLISVEEAQRRLFRAVRPIARAEIVPLEAGLGRVAAQTYRAPRPVPPFARATWDGYAFRAAETQGASPERPARFEVVGDVFADRAYPGRLAPGEAVAIAAGGRLPDGADTMAIFEEVDVRGSQLAVPRSVPLRNRIADPGEDFPRGARLVRRGEPLTPAALGALAASGATRVRVFERPRVALIPNGTELAAPGRRLRPGQIYETNNVTLGAVVRAHGGIPLPVPPVVDDPRRIARAIRSALARSDLVLLTGGSSVGEHDYLPTIFPRIGRLLFHGIAVRPGKPTLAATARGRVVLGMPGHPTSCLSNGYWLLLPALRKLARLPGPGWTEDSARLAEACDPPSRTLSMVLPLRVEDGWGHPTFHGSSNITSLSGANAYALVPPGHGPLRRGTRLPVRRLFSPVAAT